MGQLFGILSDEFFYSLLAKERRWYEDELKRGVSYYPYDRALTFKSELDHQGDNDYKFPLQESKDIITRIGNAIGLLRMLRSATLHNQNKTKEYCTMLIDENDSKHQRNTPFERSYQRIQEYLQKFQDTTDILPCTSKVLHDKEKEILCCIYILYPPLSLLWLDSSASGKEMLRRKIKTSEGYYTDDGFAFGFAYLFEVIDRTQGRNYDTLNWSHSFRLQFSQEKSQMVEKAEIVKATSKSQKSALSVFASDNMSQDDEYTRLQVLAKRLETRRQEFDLLLYCMNAARVVFGSA